MTTALSLAALTIVLAGPVPVLLGRARWPYLVPRAAIVLWQSIACSAVLAALGAGLATGLMFVVDHGAGGWHIVLQAVVLLATTIVALRLGWSVLRVAIDLRSRRRRHRQLVDVLSEPDPPMGSPSLTPHLRVLAEQRPVAYCLPALREARVVVSRGTVDQLEPGELRAVLAHELAHVRARHDLVLEAFTGLRRAFPWTGRSTTALERNQLLVEMVADDTACRSVHPSDLGRALVHLAVAPAAGAHGGLAASDTGTVLRLNRLAATERGRGMLAGATYVAAAGLLAVPTFTLALPWLQSLYAAIN